MSISTSTDKRAGPSARPSADGTTVSLRAWATRTGTRARAAGVGPFPVVAAIALMLSPWLARIEGTAEVALFALPVLALGLPHGAMDTPVAHSLGLWRGPASLLAFVFAYVALAAGTLLLWFSFPGPILAALLLVSVHHFGGDWKGWIGGAGAVGIVGWPALWHGGEVAEIFGLLSTPGAGAALATLFAGAGAVALVATPVALLVAAFRGRPVGEGPAEPDAGATPERDAIELALLALLAFALPPLLFFAVYFCALHAPRHVEAVAARHGAALRTGRTATALGTLGGTALVIALGLAPSGIVPLAPAWTDGSAAAGSVNLMGAVFMALLALTVPHMALEAITERIDRRAQRR